MLTREDFLSLNFVKKEDFTGSHLGIRFMLHQAAALLNATSVIDKATTKGVYHKNYASRKVSRLSWNPFYAAPSGC